MNGTGTRKPMGWSTRLLIAVVLVIAGAAAATWALARYQPAARFLGVVPANPPPARVVFRPQPVPRPVTQPAAEADDRQIAELNNRVERVESATARAEGSAGRADALVVAFATRRAIDRGVALGYLENLLVSRFGARHRAAVSTIISGSRQPVRLDDLIAAYDDLGPDLRRSGPEESWWTSLKRELGSLVEIHSTERPAANPDARYTRAQQRLANGNVDQALAETMRLPGAARAGDWIGKARRYIAVHRALDEIESAALLPGPNGQA
ncbi:MAG TPA: hypothetical protein VFM42_02310 [Sphingomicrobium sp.]|jgi:hypothetical protein|nr:hypothetical protein [Sphingomicrobium sp.]